MGELTSEAASKPPLRLSVGLMRGHPSPSSSPLPGFSVFSMPFYRHQSVWRGDTTRPVSPGVGHEFVKLESCLFLFPPPFYTFLVSSSPVFSIMRPSLLSPLQGGTKGQSGSLEYSEEYVDTWRRIISSSFNFQFSRWSTFNGEEKSRYLFQNSLDRVYTEFESISDIGFEGGVRVIFITKSKLETIGALEFQFRRVIRVRG